MGMNKHRDRVFDEMTTPVSDDDNKDMKFRGIILMKSKPEVACAAQKVFRIYEDRTPWVTKDIQLLENSAAELQTNWKTLEIQETYTSLNIEESTVLVASEISFFSNQLDSDAEKLTEFLRWDNTKETHSAKSDTNKQHDSPIGYNDQENEPNIIGGFDGFKLNVNATNNVTSEKSCHIIWNDHVECYKYPLETSTSTMEVRVTPHLTDNPPRIRSQPDFFHDNSTKNIHNQKQTGANAEPSQDGTKNYRKMCAPSHDNSHTLRNSSERFIKCEELNVGKKTKRTVPNSQMESFPWHNNDQSRPNAQHGDANSKPSDLGGLHFNNNTRSEICYLEDSTISCYKDENNDSNFYDVKKSVSDRKNAKDSSTSQKEYLLAGEENFTKNSLFQKKDSVDCRTCRCSRQEQSVEKESNHQNETNKQVLTDKRKRTLRSLLGLDASDDTDVLVMLKI